MELNVKFDIYLSSAKVYKQISQNQNILFNLKQLCFYINF